MKTDKRILGIMIKIGDALHEIEDCAVDVLKSIERRHDYDDPLFKNRVERLNEAIYHMCDLENAINAYELPEVE